MKKALKEWQYDYMLSASMEGVVGFQEFWGKNQFINSGEVVFSILPIDTDNLGGQTDPSRTECGQGGPGAESLGQTGQFSILAIRNVDRQGGDHIGIPKCRRKLLHLYFPSPGD